MSIQAFKNVTAGAKLALVNNKLGNPALKKNQGSTFEIYDYIEVTSTIGTNQVLRFFGSVNTKTFPFTNIQQNQLQVGEALAVEYIALTRLEITTAGGVDKLTAQTSLLTVTGLALSQFSLLLDNSRILKNNSLTRANTIFNPKGQTGTNSLFYPDTDLTIPPQISFTAELQTPANSDTVAEGKKVFYGCHLFGTGAILNLKTNV
jgi:hypothetical protein